MASTHKNQVIAHRHAQDITESSVFANGYTNDPFWAKHRHLPNVLKTCKKLALLMSNAASAQD